MSGRRPEPPGTHASPAARSDSPAGEIPICPYLVAAKRSFCIAVRVTYHPGASELETRCLGAGHRKCPFYCNVATDGECDLTKLDLWPFDPVA